MATKLIHSRVDGWKLYYGMRRIHCCNRGDENRQKKTSSERWSQPIQFLSRRRDARLESDGTVVRSDKVGLTGDLRHQTLSLSPLYCLFVDVKSARWQLQCSMYFRKFCRELRFLVQLLWSLKYFLSRSWLHSVKRFMLTSLMHHESIENVICLANHFVFFQSTIESQPDSFGRPIFVCATSTNHWMDDASKQSYLSLIHSFQF